MKKTIKPFKANVHETEKRIYIAMCSDNDNPFSYGVYDNVEDANREAEYQWGCKPRWEKKKDRVFVCWTYPTEDFYEKEYLDDCLAGEDDFAPDAWINADGDSTCFDSDKEEGRK